ncbi:MAG: hypothetical protein IT183_00710 [Acidobacteria bacterium]|nr:hypothetical protein [Acidobacteriota bacterium]
MRTLRRSAAAILFMLATPAVALACPVCGTAGPNDNGWAYFAMTIVLSGLPLGMIGGVVYWVHRRSSDADSAGPSDR